MQTTHYFLVLIILVVLAFGRSAPASPYAEWSYYLQRDNEAREQAMHERMEFYYQQRMLEEAAEANDRAQLEFERRTLGRIQLFRCLNWQEWWCR